MRYFRCPKCNKLLFKATGNATIEIKCSRCSYLFVTKVSTDK